MASDETENAIDLASLFVNTNYERDEITVPCYYTDDNGIEDREGGKERIANVTVKVARSISASTDFDLTGQILWPVSALLAHYVASEQGQTHVVNKNVVELGAGCGLPGLVDAHFAKKVALTDGNDVVVDLMEQNRLTFISDFPDKQHNLVVSKLVWGCRQDLIELMKNFHQVDVILAADVVQWPAVVEPLLHTMKALLWTYIRDKHVPICVLGIVTRSQSTTDLFFQTAQVLGFSFRKVKYHDFLQDGIIPESCKEFGGRSTEIYELSLTDYTAPPVLLQSDSSQDIFIGKSFGHTSSLPC